MVKAALMSENGEIEIKDMEKPELKPGEILIKTLYSEVCGTDVHLKHNRLAGVPYPIIPGHVSVGTIEEVAGEITDINDDLLQNGDTVTFLDVNETCNDCYTCLVNKATTRCPNRKVYGITYSAKDGLLGGWSQYILLKKDVKVIKLPKTVEPKNFIAAGCGLPTAIHAVERADIALGDTVIVQGAGPVGLMSAILAKVSGAFTVIMVGAPAHRLKIATEFGIDHVIDINEYDPDKRVIEVLRLTQGRGADVTIEATGNPQALKEGMQMTRDTGTYVVVGQYTNAGDVQINPHNDINKKHLNIRGSWGSDFSHFYLAVEFVAHFNDKYPWDEIISRIYYLDEIEEALQDVEALNVMKAVIAGDLSGNSTN